MQIPIVTDEDRKRAEVNDWAKTPEAREASARFALAKEVANHAQTRLEMAALKQELARLRFERDKAGRSSATDYLIDLANRTAVER